MGVLPDNEDEGAFQRNLTCLNSIVQMLHSIPEVVEVFEEQSFKSDISITDVCDEIHRVLKLNSDAADLRVALGSQSGEDPYMLFAKQQNFEVVFYRYVYEAVRSELNESSTEIRKVWDKFTSGKLGINFIEISERSTDSVGEFLNKKYTPEMLPDFLFLKIVRKISSTNELKLRSENRIQMKNGDVYRLTCIIDKNRLGTYSTTESHDGAWSRVVEKRRRYFAEADVKTERNYAYLYVKQKPAMVLKDELTVKVERIKNEYICRVPGCPDDLGFPTKEVLQDHMKQEHQSCPSCGKQFLLRSLHKEHVIHCHSRIKTAECKPERKRSRWPTDPDSGVESLIEDIEAFKPKRKWIEKFVEETKITNDANQKHCKMDGCFEIGRHWCFHSADNWFD